MATKSRTPGPAPDRILGSSPALREALVRADRVARHRVAVLLCGESGTGKELFARRIHAQSGRRGAFVAVNCAAIPRDLLESELFGHERGAFTGALAARAGAFERAHRGTLFLDEIGDLALEHQAKLLRAVQEGEVQRVGAGAARGVDVRLITATHRDLLEHATAGRFRDDLYYRLAGYVLRLPPLRDRGRDAIQLAEALLTREFPGKVLSTAARAVLMRHRWPGNIRELHQVVRAAAIDAGGDRITMRDVKQHLVAPAALRRRRAAQASVDVVAALFRDTPRLSPAAIQAALGVGKTQRHRVLVQLEIRGVLIRGGNGPATFYTFAGGPANGAAE